jgi:peptidoglycan-N-acetylglucosamine deacetylase
VRRLVLVGLLVAVGTLSGVRGAEARRVGAPLPAEAVSLAPDTGDMALVTWQRQDRATTYRLCYSPVFTFAENVWCDEVGSADAWSISAPRQDGAIFYVTVQACRDGECAEPVRAGAIGRRVRDGHDFYATATPMPDGRTRLAAFVRSGPADVRYYRGAAGTGDLFESACPSVPANDSCGPADMWTRGSLVGVGTARAGGERGLTFQVRDAPMVYFMFDDGTGIVAGGRYVMQNVLDEFGVKGSFFLTGRAMQTYPSAVRALVAAGHRVGNHTWSHPFLTSLSDAAIGNELDLTEQQYRALVPGGTTKPCFRAPNGAFNARVLAVLSARGYRQITQTVSSLDYAGISAGQIIRNVLNDMHDGALISMHTQEQQTVIALRTLIPRLLAEGYRFGVPC